MYTKTDIKKSVQNSTELNEQNKEAILRLLPSMNADQIEELGEMFLNVDENKQGAIALAIEKAVLENDTEFLNNIDEISREASIKFREGEELIENAEDKRKLENIEFLFDEK